MNKNILYSAFVALLVTVVSFFMLDNLFEKERTVKVEHINSLPGKQAVFTLDEDNNVKPLDFSQTAEEVIDAVVHIKSTFLIDYESDEYPYRNIPDSFRDFFGDEFERFFGPENPSLPRGNKPNHPPTRMGSGSGVIISEDGYIVTNNHVINRADDIEVILHDNRSYKATVIGTDPATDLALVKIDEDDLPALAFINSDEVRIGEWVMAVGNPFSLTSTVTAGIVSAKGRNINILRDQYAIENFIQTDAAINPGNSGGALVNLEGGLVGINTAIASPTGVYSGYGFAVPANIVKKVIEDFIEYGVVQRGVLGVLIRTVDGSLAKAEGLNLLHGVYVDSLLDNSAAKQAGIREGDVIVRVNNREIMTSPQLQGAIAQYRPGEKVNVTVNRKGKEIEYRVTLNNREGTTDVVAMEKVEILQKLGIEIEPLPASEAKKLGIKGGVRVKELFTGKLKRQTQMREGFIITKVDNRNISSREEFIEIMENKTGGVMIEGIYPDIEGEFYYAFGM